MNKPTDGPWEIKHSQSKDAWNIIGTRPGGLYKIARLPYMQDKRMGAQWDEAQKAEQLVNAKLIGAAPSLYKALKDVMASYEAYLALSDKPEDRWDEYDYIMFPRWQEAARIIAELDKA
jgi:hypothetical protein